jgi:tetratricopeptide (TPR) repeat protein
MIAGLGPHQNGHLRPLGPRQSFRASDMRVQTHRRRLTVISLSSALVLSAPAWAAPAAVASGAATTDSHAASVATPETRPAAGLPAVISTNATLPTPVGDGVWQILNQHKAELCAKQPGHSVPSVKRAELTAWSIVVSREGRHRVAELKASKLTRTVKTAELAAAQAVASDRLDAAVVVLLTALDRTPHNPRLTLNLASVLVTLGMPWEALAFLNSAKGSYSTLSMRGNDGEAAAETTRGAALEATGRYAQADAEFTSALKRQPTLSQAAAGTVADAVCRKNKARALAYYAHGINNFDAPTSGPTPVTTELRWPRLKVGKGTPFQPWSIDLPADIPSMYRLTQSAPSLSNEISSASQELQARSEQEFSAMSAFESKWTALSASWDLGLNLATAYVKDEGTVPALMSAAFEAHNRFFDYESAYVANATDDAVMEKDIQTAGHACESEDPIPPLQECFYPKCRAIASGPMATLAALFRQANEAYLAEAAARHGILTGLAALTSDPHRKAYMLTNAASEEVIESDDVVVMLQELDLATSEVFNCFNPAAYPTTIDLTPKDGGDPGKCPYEASLDIEIMELSHSCDVAKMTLKTPGPLALFTEFGFDNKAGRITVYAGAQAGYNVHIGPGAAVKAGGYVTVDPLSGAYEVGIRLSSEVSVNAGPIAVKATPAETDIVIVPEPAIPLFNPITG